MLLVIDAHNKDRFSKILDDVNRLRARRPRAVAGGGIDISDDRSNHAIDEPDLVYIVSLDDEFNVVGSACLQPATGRHGLSDILEQVFDAEFSLNGKTIWECTQFCVESDHTHQSYTTCTLMAGILEHARSSGIAEIVTVIDPEMDRVLRCSATAPHSYVGGKAGPGDAPTLAALIDCSEERIAQLRALAGLEGDIFLSDEAVDAALPPPVMTPLAGILQDYCSQQIAAARTRQEMIDAVALRQALKGRFQPKRRCDA